MEDASKEKTSFITHNGLYEFNVLPFGLRNSPASFQRVTTKQVFLKRLFTGWAKPYSSIIRRPRKIQV